MSAQERTPSEVTEQGSALVSDLIANMVPTGMPVGARLLMITLLSCTTDRRCYVPAEELAQWTALTPFGLVRHLRELTRRGWLREVGPNEYEVRLTGAGWPGRDRARRAAPRRRS